MCQSENSYNQKMQLTIYTDYALRVLIFLATKEDRSQISEISSYYNISFNHLTKAVHHLSKLGYVKSQQGRGGGIELAMNPKDINIGKVLEACEPSMAMVECMGSDNKCVITSACHLKTIMIKAKKAFLNELRQHHLSDIINHKNSEIKKFIEAGNIS